MLTMKEIPTQPKKTRITYILLVIVIILAAVNVIQTIEINNLIKESAGGELGVLAPSSSPLAARSSSQAAPAMVGGC